MASIKEAEPFDGTHWRVRVSTGKDHTSNRYRTVERTVHGSHKDAERVARRMQVDVEDGKVTADHCTLGALLDQYIAQCVSEDRAPKTVYDYRRMAKWLTAEAGKTQARRLTGVEIDNLMAKVVREKGRSSADHYFRFLRAAMRYGVKKRLLGAAPTDWATAPSPPEPEPVAPEAKEVRQILDLVENEDPDLAAIVWVAAVTGLRRGEVCALTIRDVDLQRSEIIKRHAVSRVDRQTYVRPTKTKKTYRVAIDPLTKVVIGEQIRRVHASCELAGVKVVPDTYLWSDEVDHSRPLIPDTLSGRWKRLAHRVGIENRFHSLRHFSATVMLGNGVSAVVAAAQLGHSSPAVTEEVYAHVIPSHAHSAAAIVAGAITKGTDDDRND